MPIVPKTVLVARPGFADGVLINAGDFDEKTDVLWSSDSAPAAPDLIAAQELLAELEAAKAPAAEVAAAKAMVASLTPEPAA